MESKFGKRILVIGSPGSGKSTFSRRLSDLTALGLYHLDRIYWLPGWKPVTEGEFDRKLRDILSLDNWIIDGNYQRTLKLRFERADTVIYLDYRRYICLYRSLKRTILDRGNRSDITEGCEEKLNTEFLRWIWNYWKRNRHETLNLIANSRGKNILRFETPRQLKKFMAEFEDSQSEKSSN